jgi:hypothetical protein
MCVFKKLQQVNEKNFASALSYDCVNNEDVRDHYCRKNCF